MSRPSTSILQSRIEECKKESEDWSIRVVRATILIMAAGEMQKLRYITDASLSNWALKKRMLQLGDKEVVHCQDTAQTAWQEPYPFAQWIHSESDKCRKKYMKVDTFATMNSSLINPADLVHFRTDFGYANEHFISHWDFIHSPLAPVQVEWEGINKDTARDNPFTFTSGMGDPQIRGHISHHLNF